MKFKAGDFVVKKTGDDRTVYRVITTWTSFSAGSYCFLQAAGDPCAKLTIHPIDFLQIEYKKTSDELATWYKL